MTKLKWGMIGGGEGSQIGPAHRLGAVADGRFELVAAAFDHRPAKGKAFAESLGIDMLGHVSEAGPVGIRNCF